MADPQFMLAQDLENLRDILEGEATPEEVQQRASAAKAQSGVEAFVTSGAGLALMGGLILVLILRRLAGGPKADDGSGHGGGVGRIGAHARSKDDRKFRFMIEF